MRQYPLKVSYLIAVIAQGKELKWEEVARYESRAPEGQEAASAGTPRNHVTR